MALPASMIGYSQRIDELCAVYNVCPDKLKNTKRVINRSTKGNNPRRINANTTGPGKLILTKPTEPRMLKKPQQTNTNKSVALENNKSSRFLQKDLPVITEGSKTIPKQKCTKKKCTIPKQVKQIENKQLKPQKLQKLVSTETKNVRNKKCTKNSSRKSRLQLESECCEQNLYTDLDILQQLVNSNAEGALSFGGEVLKKIDQTPGGSAVQKLKWKGGVFYFLLKGYIANGDLNKALDLSRLLFNLAKKLQFEQLLYDCYNVSAQLHVKLEDYEKAASLWEEMMEYTSHPAEQAYLLHEIGRCYYALSQWSEALTYGSRCLSAAKDSDARKWCMNANLLIGQANTRLGCPKEAIQAFEDAELYATTINDERVLEYVNVMKKLLQDVANNSVYAEDQ